MKNIHRILFAAIALCAVMMLTACNPSASKPAETVTPTEEPTSSYSSSSHGSSNYTNSYDMFILGNLWEGNVYPGRLRKDKIMGEAMIQKIRTNQLPSWTTLETICELLNCQPADLIEYSKEPEKHKN